MFLQHKILEHSELFVETEGTVADLFHENQGTCAYNAMFDSNRTRSDGPTYSAG
jgi:hypothetical protein